MESFEQRLESTGALADDVRRALYLFIRAARRPVGRDEAAQAVGISRKLAAFHLDKLVEKGLLAPRYARLTGRSGPGAGRPAKVYEPAGVDVAVSIPFRSYEVVGDILLDALETRRSSSRSAAVREAAFRRGEELGRTEGVVRSRRRASDEAALEAVREILADRGYEPYSDERGGVRLHNCPFHALAQRSPELVCAINQALVDGVLAGIGTQELEAVLDPHPGECCVHLRPKEVVA
ncbi:MAG: helix-turn-helix transcriptional regulator [Actinomycetota bacterium]